MRAYNTMFPSPFHVIRNVKLTIKYKLQIINKPTIRYRVVKNNYRHISNIKTVPLIPLTNINVCLIPPSGVSFLNGKQKITRIMSQKSILIVLLNHMKNGKFIQVMENCAKNLYNKSINSYIDKFYSYRF